ncbi:MAG: S24 family peptidase [Deferribacteraceae bacterium]|jgi:phage repressor protein C with HTH and peptisase S24 domain|nr:S24 family peptidase [Deferribacteraceae bacterium]
MTKDEIVGEKARTVIKGNYISVPYYHHITPLAGTGADILDCSPDGTYYLPPTMFKLKTADDIAILFAKGDSMYLYIKGGDGILVNFNETMLSVEATYLIRWRNTLLIKDIQKIPNGMRLISRNPAYESIILTGETVNEVRIVGRILGSFCTY